MNHGERHGRENENYDVFEDYYRRYMIEIMHIGSDCTVIPPLSNIKTPYPPPILSMVHHNGNTSY